MIFVPLEVDYKLVASALIIYGLSVLYAYQVGFFALVGFEYASLTSTLDLWTNAELLIAYGFPTGAAFLILLMIGQGSKQLGFDLVRWTADHEGLVAVLMIAVATSPLIVMAIFERNFHFYVASVIVTFIVNVAIVYCNVAVYQRIPAWTLIFAVLTPLFVAAILGGYSAYYGRRVETKRFNIFLENSQLSSIRLLRVTSSGIVYADADGQAVSFVNASKVVRIAPSP